MAVPSSGTISIQDLVDEFGGSTPHAMSEYYRGGSEVPNVPANSGIPTSGTLALSDFYGAVDAVFIAATGGTVTTSGDFKIHTFTSSGTFEVTTLGNSAGSNTVEYLVVAGGGGGGSDHGGGGGAGGLRHNFPSPATGGLSVSATTFPITVGGGGAANLNGRSTSSQGSNGANSVFSSITSAGGGGGNTFNNRGSTAKSGGSGGGSSRRAPGGAGNTPPVTPSQGNNGGTTSPQAPAQ